MSALGRMFAGLRGWFDRSIANRVAFLAAAMTILLVVSIGGASYWLARSLVQQNAQDQLDAYASLVAQRVELSFNNMAGDLTGLAANSLIVTALVDTQSRAAYLQPFLRDYKPPTRSPVLLTLVDFQGRTLASSRNNAPSYVGAAWLKPVLEQNLGHAEISRAHGGASLVLVQPVIFPATGQAEGALVMEANIGDVLARTGFVSISEESRLMQQGAVLLAANPVAAGEATMLSAQELDLATVLMPLGLSVQILKSRRDAVAPLNKLGLAYLALGVIILSAALWYARASARRVVEPLRRLSRVANEVSEKGDLQVAMPVAGPDEVGRLAHSFDAMLGSLRDAQEHLEEQVAQRTEALQRAETRLQAVLDHVVEGIITVDAQGTIESCNHSAEAMLGFTTAQLCGRDLAGLFEQASALAFLAEHAAAAHCDPPLEAPREVNVIRADGVMFPGEIAASEMWVDGRRRFVVMLRDITERQRVDRLKREFVSTVSHELRTPLTSIRGALGLLAGGVAGGLPDEAKAMVDIARKNAERLINLINDILDIEKIESGKMSFAMAEVELMPLVKQALEANHAYGEQFGVCFALRGELLAARVRVDQERLVQVITNLLSNAAKFSPRGAVVEVTATESPPGWARVSVRDQGPGIADAFQDKLFQRFSQADASDSRQKGGTGLGLAISKAIVEHMHGHIGYATESGVGATFYVEFPLVCAAST